MPEPVQWDGKGRIDKWLVHALGETPASLGASRHEYLSLVGRFWLESIARIPCQVEIASEFRYRSSFIGRKNLAIFISQSGETLDTLSALRSVPSGWRSAISSGSHGV